MQKSRLIEVLRTFSKKELREFKKWLASPFHNQRQDVIALYEFLLKKDRLFKEEEISKEKVFPYLYSGEPFDDAKMRQVMHFLFKQIELFLTFSVLLNQELKSKITLLKVYRERNLDKSFSKLEKEIKNHFNNTFEIAEEYPYQQFLFHKELYEYNSLKKRTQTLNLQELSDSFDLSYIGEKLRQACLILSHQKVFKAEYNTGLLQKVIEYIQTEKLFDHPRIRIYYFLYKITLSKENLNDFYALKKSIKEKVPIPKSEVRGVFLLAINFCITLSNSGNEQFVREVFDLYKLGIERKIFIENGILSRWTFKNIIAAGLRLNEYEWTEHFMNENGKHLEKEYRESYLYFNKAKLLFSKGNYNEAMDLVNQYEFKDILMNLNAKTMLLKMYYELSEYQALESLLESMRAYIQRKKKFISSQHFTLYKNVIRYTKKLIKVNPYNKEQVAKLRKEIEVATPLTEKAWLLKQLDEL